MEKKTRLKNQWKIRMEKSMENNDGKINGKTNGK